MSRILATFVCAAALTAVPRLAAAETLTIYDTIDSLDARPIGSIRITGVIAGAAAPSTTFYTVGSSPGTDHAARCERLALLAMAKPGKFQFIIVDESDFRVTCRLRVRTP